MHPLDGVSEVGVLPPEYPIAYIVLLVEVPVAVPILQSEGRSMLELDLIKLRLRLC